MTTNQKNKSESSTQKPSSPVSNTTSDDLAEGSDSQVDASLNKTSGQKEQRAPHRTTILRKAK